MVLRDIRGALDVLAPVYDVVRAARDGFVSVEVAPDLARDTDGTVDRRPPAARARSTGPNLLVKIPAHGRGRARPSAR